MFDKTKHGRVAVVLFLAVMASLSWGFDAQNKPQHSRLPVSFTANPDYWPEHVQFSAIQPGASFYFSPSEVEYVLYRKNASQANPHGATKSACRPNSACAKAGHGFGAVSIKARFLGADADACMVGEEQLAHMSHFYLGSQRSAWRTNVPNFSNIRYVDLYPGIDLKYFGDDRRLKYDFIVKPNANPDSIRIQYQGIHRLETGSDGQLIVRFLGGSVTEQPPYAYQMINGEETPVDVRYAVLEDDTFTFTIDESYDRSVELVIDPAITYSGYLGGSSFDQVGSIKADLGGHAYVIGATLSPNFPATGGPIPATEYSVFVSKFLPDGTALAYSTFLGGDESDIGYGIDIDGAGNAFLTGTTGSSNFPTTVGAYDTTFNGANPGLGDIFVASLNPAGALVYSTYFGGTQTDISKDIAVDGAGDVQIVGYSGSNDYPVTAGAYQTVFDTATDVVVSKLQLLGTGAGDLLYSTYLAGDDSDEADGIEVDAGGNIYIAGATRSSNFPGSGGPPFNGTFDAFVAKVAPNGAGAADLVYGRIIGGSDHDYGLDVDVDTSNQAHVTGVTSSADFQTTGGVVQPAFQGGATDGFVAKLDAAGVASLYSTYLGTAGNDRGHGVSLDIYDHAYVTGSTDNAGFPVSANGFDTTYNGGLDIFVSAMETDGSTILYSTFLGGTIDDIGYAIDVTATDFWYITGTTQSLDYPISLGVFDSTYNGGLIDVVVTKAPGRIPPPPASLPIGNGEMVATCFSGPFDPGNPNIMLNGFVVSLVDSRIPPVGANPIPVVDNNWLAPMFHNEVAPTSLAHTWHCRNMGQVFGVCLDDAPSPNIFVSATTAYGDFTSPVALCAFGPGGFAGIYRLDGTNGDISTLTTTVANGFGGVGTSQIPNEGTGIGNLCYHENNGNPQLFATNHEDGKIYRLDTTGVILSEFDPFDPDSGLPGFAPLGERLWGVQTYNGRLYFSVWLRDGGNTSTAWPTAAGPAPTNPNNSIWSVALDAGTGDFVGAPTLEIVMPYLGTTGFSMPVADIAFSDTGLMLVSERTMNGPYGTIDLSHSARVLEFTLVGTTWFPQEYYIGNTINASTGAPENASGGIDYDCDLNVWATGDTLHDGSPDLLYGFQRVPAGGNTPIPSTDTSYLIDADHDPFSGGKATIGDVEVHKRCFQPPTVCNVSADHLTCEGTCPNGIDVCAPKEILADSNGFLIEVTCCECGPTECQLEVVPGTPFFSCTSTCPSPPGFECQLIGKGNADGTISYSCDCVDPTVPQDCEFMSQCDVNCPGVCVEQCTGICPVATEACLPSIVTESPAGSGHFTVTDCDCSEVSHDPCRPIINPVTNAVDCVGSTCAIAGISCQLVVTNNADGTTDYTCCPGGEPIGACCYVDAVGVQQCVETTETDCLANLFGFYFGDGTLCTGVMCSPPPVTGACCYVDALGVPDCTITTQIDCMNNLFGIYQGDGSTCTPDPCEEGACCYQIQMTSITDCQIMSPASCASLGGIYQGAGSTCTPFPCGEEGACCIDDCPQPMCMVTWYADCVSWPNLGTYLGDNTLCDPMVCELPTGACCSLDAVGDPICSIETLSCCTEQANGSYLGDGTVCATDTCEVKGACCRNVGGVTQCDEVVESDCLAPDIYHGDGTVCTPDACCDKPTVIYALSGSGGIFEVDPDAATTTFLGAIPGGFDLAAGPDADTLFVTLSNGDLYEYSIGGNTFTFVGSGVPFIASTEGKDGWLYTASGSTMYQVDPNTGANTLLGAGVDYYSGDLATDNCGTAYGLVATKLSTVSKVDGSQTLVGNNGLSLWGLAYSADGRLWAGRPGGNLLQLDKNTGLVLQTAMNLGFTAFDLASQPHAPCNDCAPPPKSMREWWPFDETTVPPSVIPTAVGMQGLDGMHMNGPTPVAGAVNVALEFDGVDDYVEVPNAPKINFGNWHFSIDAWIKTSAGTGLQPIVDKRVPFGLSARGYMFYLLNGELAFQLGDTSGATDYVRPGFIADGQWHHVAVTVRRNNVNGLKLYVDGVSVSFDPTPRNGNINNPADLWIGASHPIPTSNFFEGRIDEVQIFRKPISAAKVISIYEAGSTGKCKQRCKVPSPLLFCKNQNIKNVNIQICNYSPTPITYSWSLAGPLTGTGCDPLGAMSFLPSSGSVTVSGGCQSIPVSITKPVGLTPGDTGCYDLTVTNTAIGDSFGCDGKIKATNKWCFIVIGTVPIGPKKIGVGSVTKMDIEVTNDEDASGQLNYEFSVVSGDKDPVIEAISLDGLPPGTPVTGSIPLAVGETGTVSIDVLTSEYQPFNFHDIVMSADLGQARALEPVLGVTVETEEVLFAPSLAPSGYPAEAPKNRYISFVADPANLGTLHGYEVTHVGTSKTWFISSPRTSPLEIVGRGLTYLVSDETPPLADFAAMPIVHVGGCMIAPGEVYEVRATDGVFFSAPLTVSTTPIPTNQRWWSDVAGVFSVTGDPATTPPTPPNSWKPADGAMNGFDVTATLRGFQKVGEPDPTWTDLNPEQPDRVTNGNDVLRAVNAFATGTSREFYPYNVPDAPGPQGQGPCAIPPLEANLNP